MDEPTRGSELYTFLKEKTVAAMVRRLGNGQHGIALDVANEVCDELIGEWGGQSIYLPRALLAQLSPRNEAIMAEFNGRNQAFLAKKHNLSEVRIYQIVQAMKKKQRAELSAYPFGTTSSQ